MYAPGTGILTTTLIGYSAVSGTSMSTPLVTGGLATIISGLKAQEIPYNTGVLKAALMNGATKFNQSELIQGQGFVHFNNTWNNITSAAKDENNLPIMLEATPQTGFFEHLTNIRQNTETLIPFTVITSHPENIIITLKSSQQTEQSYTSFTEILPVNTSQFSQLVYLNIKPQMFDVGTYGGQIEIKVRDEEISLDIELILQAEPDFKVLFDVYHTGSEFAGSIGRAGYRTGTFIEKINQAGGWVDIVDSRLDANILQSYDIIWIPDPFRSDSPEPTGMGSDEVAAIREFVENGGDVIIHYLGLFEDPYIAQLDNVFGTDLTMLNSLIGNFDMEAVYNGEGLAEYFLSEGALDHELILNTSRIGYGVEKISKYATNKISTNGRATLVTEDSSIATYTSELGGRVLVSSTDAWFTSIFADNDPTSSDSKFTANVIDWFNQDERIVVFEYSQNNMTLAHEFSILRDGLPINSDPLVLVKKDGIIQNVSEFEELVDGTRFKLTVDISKSGQYEVLIQHEDTEYLRWIISKNLSHVFDSDNFNLSDPVFIAIGIVIFLGVASYLLINRRHQ
ncbi:MAG: S8 family serine peptidase [Candidatus Heimdallarchaeota archaeon]|nr:S8 family serine peptidase [Candidatus Heimdallarchaeota archaeon]